MLPILNHLSEGVAIARPEPWRVAFANPVLAEWLNRLPAEVAGQPLTAMLGASCRAEVLELVDRVWRGSVDQAEAGADLCSSDGAVRPAAVRLCRLEVAQERLVAMIFRVVPGTITAGRPAAARRDPLTGLPDREFLMSRLSSLLQGERSADHQFAVLFIDLDNFKQVNDRFGHLAGDDVLRTVASRLAGCVREEDHVVRFGGDEFVVLLEGTVGQHEIDPVIARIHLALAERIMRLPDREFSLSLSVGVAEASAEHRSPADILGAADRAMYAAKRMAASI